jgi:hypothetical protein
LADFPVRDEFASRTLRRQPYREKLRLASAAELEQRL